MSKASVAPPAQIDALTGIRGVAAFWVAFHHLKTYRADGLLGMWGFSQLSGDGWMAVDLFFVLSGFIMMHVHGEEFRSLSLARARRFIGLRFIRIYPAHLAVLLLHLPLFLAAVALGMGVNHDAFSMKSFVLSTFMLNGWGFPGSEGWNVPSWSVSSEWFAYLLFPLIALGVLRLRSRWVSALAIVALLVAVTVLGGTVSHWRQFELPFAGVLVRVTSEFAMGCLTYQFYRSPIGGHVGETVAGLGLLGVVAISLASLHPIFNVLSVACFVLIVVGLSQATGLIARFLSTKPMVYLGRISYSAYIIHTLVLAVYARLISRMATGGVALETGVVLVYALLVVAASHILFSVVEEPARRWLRRTLIDGPQTSGEGMVVGVAPVAERSR